MKRSYDPARDRDAALRIWRECGWITKSEDDAKGVDYFLGGGHNHVAELDGEAECLVCTRPLRVSYLGNDLNGALVASVTTSRIARKSKLASRLTASAIAEDAKRGAALSMLGMFEQGYYNRLGFGTGTYSHRFRVDPNDLLVPNITRHPCRLGRDDWRAIHSAFAARKRVHGGVVVDDANLFRAEQLFEEESFGLGFRDGEDGELTHYLWFHKTNGELGPYSVGWTAWQTTAQFIELLGVLKSLGDQIDAVVLDEPVNMQLQDLVRKPIRASRKGHNSKSGFRHSAIAWWQIRINDLAQCVAATQVPIHEPVRFNLQVVDPIAEHLVDNATWTGCGGDYIVELGSKSHAERGQDSRLPTMSASLNAFSRYWFGVANATALSMTDDLQGPSELLDELDSKIILPKPAPDCPF